MISKFTELIKKADWNGILVFTFLGFMCTIGAAAILGLVAKGVIPFWITILLMALSSAITLFIVLAAQSRRK